MLKLIAFVIPLGLDTFGVSAALGVAGLPKRDRLRVSLLLSGFEAVMPLVGLLLGHVLGSAVGEVANYIAAAALIALGIYMLVADEDDEAASLRAAHGLAAVGLGLSISLDELAMGFTIGLLHLSIWLAVVLIGTQAFVVAQLGLRLGAKLGKQAGERAEQLAGVALVALGLYVLISG